MERHRVVVVGGGFGGLRVVHGLRRADVDITLVDRRNFHLFQPLTYQVATGALDPGQIAAPLRAMFKRQRNVHVLLGEVDEVDAVSGTIRVQTDVGARTLAYDTLVVATGSTYSYFGHDEWRESATEVKTIENALALRAQVLAAFERAEERTEVGEASADLTFIVVGAGPTGVEMAGQLAELARDTLRRDFRRIDPRHARVLVLEAGDRILGAFTPKLSARAQRSLERLGVTVMTDSLVIGIDEEGVDVATSDGETTRHSAHTVVWAAGVRASPLAAQLGETAGTGVDRAGRVTVEPDLSLPGHPNVLVMGDIARVSDGAGGVLALPGVAPVAMQQGRYAAGLIRDRLRGRSTSAFSYRDKGNVATIGRGSAVAEIGPLRFAGFVAWLLWLAVHLWYLIGFQNRLLVVTRWAFSFVTHGRGSRLITGLPPARSRPTIVSDPIAGGSR